MCGAAGKISLGKNDRVIEKTKYMYYCPESARQQAAPSIGRTGEREGNQYHQHMADWTLHMRHPLSSTKAPWSWYINLYTYTYSHVMTDTMYHTMHHVNNFIHSGARIKPLGSTIRALSQPTFTTLVHLTVDHEDLLYVSFRPQK